MKEEDANPWREEPVIEREGYQLRGNEDRDEWRTVLIVTAMIIVLSSIAADKLGGTPAPASMNVEIQSK